MSPMSPVIPSITPFALRADPSSAISSLPSSALASISASSAMSSASAALASASNALSSASSAAAGSSNNPPYFKLVGVLLAVGSGLFIGSSFVFKKKGLLASTSKMGNAAGEGHAYLKSPMWWTGMIMMVIGEILNFVAYAFTEAILVTPLGALSVVICAVLSSIFLKEKLTLFGKVGCALCVVGATVIALNGPNEQSVRTITGFQKLFLSPGFLVYGSVVIAVSLVLILYFGPRYGKKNQLVYITICSLIGGLSVACTQGLGAAIVTSIQGDNQFKHWFIYFLLAFVVVTLLTEINYLNKALELFNTAAVTPTYYVLFTTATLVTSVILYQGLQTSAIQIITVVCGFLVICAGIILLQLSKVDPEQLGKGVDRKSTILLQAARSTVGHTEKGHETFHEEPGPDALGFGGGVVGSIVRARRSVRYSQSQASNFRRRQVSGPLTTHGLDNVTRHQLYDTPMTMPELPRNASMYSGKSNNNTMPTSPLSGHPPFSPAARSATTISFASNDELHRYPAPGQAGEATHEMNASHGMPPVHEERSWAASRGGGNGFEFKDPYSKEDYTVSVIDANAIGDDDGSFHPSGARTAGVPRVQSIFAHDDAAASTPSLQQQRLRDEDDPHRDRPPATHGHHNYPQSSRFAFGRRRSLSREGGGGGGGGAGSGEGSLSSSRRGVVGTRGIIGGHHPNEGAGDEEAELLSPIDDDDDGKF